MPHWQTSPELVAYGDALAQMQAHVDAMIAGGAGERVWLLEHPPLYTAGTSAKVADMLDAARFAVYEAGRGGEYTYHGPGQRIAYVMLNLNQRGKDVRAYVQQLERWIILTLAEFGVEGFTREGRIGVWVSCPSPLPSPKGEGEANHCQEPAIAARPNLSRALASENLAEKKIAALGIRVRKWMSFHGIALNVNPDLSHYSGIVPCGIKGYGVTSLAELGVKVSMEEVDAALRRSFEKVFASR